MHHVPQQATAALSGVASDRPVEVAAISPCARSPGPCGDVARRRATATLNVPGRPVRGRGLHRRLDRHRRAGHRRRGRQASSADLVEVSHRCSAPLGWSPPPRQGPAGDHRTGPARTHATRSQSRRARCIELQTGQWRRGSTPIRCGPQGGRSPNATQPTPTPGGKRAGCRPWRPGRLRSRLTSGHLPEPQDRRARHSRRAKGRRGG